MKGIYKITVKQNIYQHSSFKPKVTLTSGMAGHGQDGSGSHPAYRTCRDKEIYFLSTSTLSSHLALSTLRNNCFVKLQGLIIQDERKEVKTIPEAHGAILPDFRLP
jgi:hypothetical protein